MAMEQMQRVIMNHQIVIDNYIEFNNDNKKFKKFLEEKYKKDLKPKEGASKSVPNK